MSLASTSSEQSPEPLFNLHDLHGQAALHVAARLGQAQVVKVNNNKYKMYLQNMIFMFVHRNKFIIYVINNSFHARNVYNVKLLY